MVTVVSYLKHEVSDGELLIMNRVRSRSFFPPFGFFKNSTPDLPMSILVNATDDPVFVNLSVQFPFQWLELHL